MIPTKRMIQSYYLLKNYSFEVIDDMYANVYYTMVPA